MSGLKKSYIAMTMIELMIVIAIIAIMATLLIPSLDKARRMAFLNSCMANLKAISTTVEMYLNDNSSMAPPDSPGLDLLSPHYITTQPLEPFSKEKYGYERDPNEIKDYTIYCSLPGKSNHGSLGVTGCFPIYSAKSGVQKN
jgi:prepilin-type N-terminal cleavage/methylation domain-containing protein